jgi:putative heme-binding domain-containing protein
VRALARGHFPAPSAEAAGVDRKAQILRLHGDARSGQRLFFGERARCYSCHRFYERGAEIGPDLSTVALKYGAGELLESILNPSAAIAFGYDAWMVETGDGQLFTGFVSSDNGRHLVLKDTTGRLEVIPSETIESRTKQKLSVMPDNAAMGLSEQELADLLEFLRSNPRVPGSRRSSMVRTSAAGPSTATLRARSSRMSSRSRTASWSARATRSATCAPPRITPTSSSRWSGATIRASRRETRAS